MDLELSGQVAVVVGGASGIGRAIAEAFGAEGCAVGLIDRDAARLEEAAAALGAAGTGRLAQAVADVADFAALGAAAEAVGAALGPADHVVAAAGAGSGKAGFPFWNLDPADWARVLEVNLMGAVHTAHAYAPGMAGRGRGTFLFLASVAGQIGSPTDPPYSAAKAGVINFMQCAARDLAPHGVRANALAPGMVKTPLNQSVWEAVQRDLPPGEQQSYEAWAEEKIKRIAPLGRWQTPPEFGAAAVFLASPHARNITGQTLNIDGGQVMK